MHRAGSPPPRDGSRPEPRRRDPSGSETVREAGFHIDRDRGATPPPDEQSHRASAITVLITAAAGTAFVVAVLAHLPPS